MTGNTADAPNTHRTLALAGLFVSSVLYALALNTRCGRRWAEKQTWTTVVAGVVLTTGWMAAEDPAAVRRNLLYFAVSGLPMVVRSLVLDFVDFEHLLDALTREKGD